MVCSDQQLADCCQKAIKAPFVALDTEFVRTRTLRPEVGLIQLYDGDVLSLIDPLAIDEWEPLRHLLLDPAVEKLLHAAGEDLELFSNLFDVAIYPLLDSQILAAFVGEPISCGLASLTQRCLGVELAKEERRTDWLQRPLREEQLRYAAADVYYLLPLVEWLKSKEEFSRWRGAIYDECCHLVQERTRAIDPEKLYRRVSFAWQLSGRELACLQILAAWRFCKASDLNLPIGFILTDESLWQVARYLPNSLFELRQLDIKGEAIRRYGPDLLAMAKQAKQLAKESLPPEIIRIALFPDYKEWVHILQLQVSEVAQQCGLPKTLLASRRQLDQLLSWHCHTGRQGQLPILLSGWRGRLLGERLTAQLELLEREGKRG